MSEWISYKLGEVLAVKYGKDHKALNPGNIPCYGSGGIMRYVDSHLSEGPSILIPRKGSLSNILFAKSSFWTVDTMFWSKIRSNIADPRFLHYQLSLIDWSSMNVGSAVPSLTVPVINDVEVRIPSKENQVAIAEVLSSIDDKIDLLNRQNETLEAMAQILFRQWFIEEAVESWEEINLGAFFPIKTGKKDANYSTTDGLYPFFTCSKTAIKAPAYSFDCAAILLAGNGDFNVKRYKGKFEAYQRTYVLSPHEPGLMNALYVIIKWFLEPITSGARGSVINFITKGMIEDFSFKYEPELLSSFALQCDNLFDKVDKNHVQISTLVCMRDTLLPKLMSGEVRVKLD